MIRTAVIVVDTALGAAALGGGIYLAAGARTALGRGFGASALRGSFWPGLFLLVAVGGSLLAAAGLLIADDIRIGRLVSVEAGVLLLGWSAVVFSGLGYRHWGQAAPVVLGIAVVLVSFALPVPG
jgi:hypothetical protein